MLSLSCRASVASLVLWAPFASGVRAQEALGVEDYVKVVLSAHPAARQAGALESAAVAERKAGRVIPDPEVEYSRDWARPTGGAAPRATEDGFAVSQTLPWPGTWSASSRAGGHAGEALRAEAVQVRWDLEIEARTAFARALHGRAAALIARAAEEDARSLRDLTAKRAELGEAREVDRIKAEVEWRRRQGTLRAAERGAAAQEAVLRTLAGETLPSPLALAGELPRSLPSREASELRDRLASVNPRLRTARAASERDSALASVARRARIPDLEAAWFRERELDKESDGFRIGLRVPLWNANRGQIARAEAGATLAAVAAERTRLDLEKALTEAQRDLDVASAQAEILDRDILPAAARSLELARFGYQEGETSLLDLLDAQRTFREIEGEATDARLAIAVTLGELQRLVGPDFHPGR